MKLGYRLVGPVVDSHVIKVIGLSQNWAVRLVESINKAVSNLQACVASHEVIIEHPGRENIQSNQGILAFIEAMLLNTFFEVDREKSAS